MIFFIENYIAGGADRVGRLIMDNLPAEVIHLYVNKRVDPGILLAEPMPTNVDVKIYNLPTIHGIYQFCLRFSKIRPLYILLRMISHILRYPILCASVVYFYFCFRGTGGPFIANNGGYPGADYCRTATIAAGLLGMKPVHVFHGIPTRSDPLTRPVEFVIDAILDRLCRMVCVSQKAVEVLGDTRNFKQTPVCIYNGAPFKIPKNYTNRSGLKLLHIGYFDENKNQETLAQCVAEVIKTGFDNIQLYLVGKEGDAGSYRKVVEMVNALGLQNHVFFLGFQDDIYPYLYDCDLLLMCSGFESFPMVILEAMSVGMPIISTRVGGIEEQVSDGVNGYLINSGDVRSFVDRIWLFYKYPHKIKEMGQKSADIFHDKFTLDKMIDRYREILTKNPGSFTGA